MPKTLPEMRLESIHAASDPTMMPSRFPTGVPAGSMPMKFCSIVTFEPMCITIPAASEEVGFMKPMMLKPRTVISLA